MSQPKVRGRTVHKHEMMEHASWHTHARVYSTSFSTMGNISREVAYLSNIHSDVFSAKCAVLGGHNQSETVIKSGAQSC